MNTKHFSPTLQSILDEITPLESEINKNKMFIAAKLDEFIELSKKNKTQLTADMKRKSTSEITKWLSGNHNFTIETLTEILWHLGKRLSDLFKEKENKPVLIYKAEVTIVYKLERANMINAYPSFFGNSGYSYCNLYHSNLHK